MPRRRHAVPLRVFLNNRLVGYLVKDPSGAIRFQYAAGWLEWEHTFPVSLSLPLREEAYHGAAVSAVFENLLPDSDALRRRVAERVGAGGTDAHALLAAIGRDCVGALQFIPEGEDVSGDTTRIDGAVLSEDDIQTMLGTLAQAPLGLNRDDDFRISVAGAQEKTALLRHGGRWLKPHGTTPTTHILKTQIGHLPNGIDLSDSVENEWYCLKLAEAFGLPVNHADIHDFGAIRALVVERFDRRWTRDGRLLRLPQEDCCQALGVPPTRKYQSDTGPGLVDLLTLLKGADDPARDQRTVLMAQAVFWLIGATDGHAKNFSLFLGPGGRFRLTPLYDILSAQPSAESRQIERKHMKLAMSVGTKAHYRMDSIHARHFMQTAAVAGLPPALVRGVLEEVAETAETAVERVGEALPPGFPEVIHESIRRAVAERRPGLVVH